MIKNERPYTNENGSVDDALITDRPYDEIMMVGEWIRENIIPCEEESLNTSYGWKHLLEDETRIYTTNNEFKDAMLLAGFKPIDQNALNWTYRAKLLREDIYNPSPFIVFLRDILSGKIKIANISDARKVVDFAEDAVRDSDFPVFADKWVIDTYLTSLGSSDSVLEAFKIAWKVYLDVTA